MNIFSTARCRAGTLVLGLLATVACSNKDTKQDDGIAAIASGSLAVRAPEPVATTPPPPEKPVIQRPKDLNDLIVSTEKRARVERAFPEAKGFLTSADLEDALYKMDLKRGKDADAVKAFDRLAKGKWVLFTGNIGSITAGSFLLPIRYTPKDPNDPMGITAVWIPIELSNVQGYDATQYQPGQLAAVLGRYDGKSKATKGYDVVLLQHYFE